MAGRRRNGEAPQIRHHKASGQAYVYYDGRSHYLGVWQSQEARRAYRDCVQRWESANRPETKRRGAVVTVADLVSAHLDWARGHYVREDGSKTDEVRAFRTSLAPLVETHADRDVETIIGRDLAAIVGQWKAEGKTRKTIGKMLGRVKRVFAWGARPENELVSETTAARLAMVRGPAIGEAADNDEVCPVRPSDLIRVVNWLEQNDRMTAAMVSLQFFCGCRPGEACRLRGDELHRGKFVVGGRSIAIPPGLVVFAPSQHKTKRRGHVVYYVLGPEAQAAIAPFIPDDGGHAFRRGGSREYVCPTYYAEMIAEACEAAGAEHWSPNRLRHNFLTRWDMLHGIELGSAAVRHKHLSTTAIYIQRDLARVGPAALASG